MAAPTDLGGRRHRACAKPLSSGPPAGHRDPARLSASAGPSRPLTGGGRSQRSRVRRPAGPLTRGGRVDLYAGFCCRPPLPARRWRPFILARRCRRARATYPQARTSSPRAPAARSCSGRGLPSRRGRPRRWWALTPPFHPHRPGPAVCSLWHCPAGRPGWPLATALLCGARTFLDPRVAPRYRGRPVGSSAPSTLPPRPPRRSRPRRFRRLRRSRLHSLTGSAASTIPPRAAPGPPAGARPRRALRCPCAQ